MEAVGDGRAAFQLDVAEVTAGTIILVQDVIVTFHWKDEATGGY